MIRKPSSGVAPVSVRPTSAASDGAPGARDARISGVRIVGAAIVSATTSAKSRSFEPK